MNLSVIGCGYLGAVHSAAMAHLGHNVVGVDVDAKKISDLSRSVAPFYEPGLPELLSEGRDSNRLSFSTDIADVAASTVHFIAVGTPQMSGSDAADLTYVNAAVAALLPFLKDGDLVVGKSTVPVGTARTLAAAVSSRGATLVWNPEFLREGFAVEDSLRPDRIVYGLDARASDPSAIAILNRVYEGPISAGIPVLETDFETAELVKVAANAFLATKISFINAMAEISEKVGADVTQLADAIGHDNRIGRLFLNAGVGFGGGCLPKDIRALNARAEEIGAGESVRFLKEIDQVNLRRRAHVLDLAIEILDGDVRGRRIAILGLSFKPNSDDVRDSPALDIVRRLMDLGGDVIAFDPQAGENALMMVPELQLSSNIPDTLRGAEVTVLLTEWPEIRLITPEAAYGLVSGKNIIDGRNCLAPEQWINAGWDYRGMGRHRHKVVRSVLGG